MESIAEDWQNSWTVFIHQVAKLVNAGATNAALTEHFHSRPIRWSGTVYNIFLDGELPGVQIMLPKVSVALKNGMSLEADFLFAPFKADEIDLWRAIQIGSHVCFETKIPPGRFPFYGVKHEILGQDFSTVNVLYDGAKLLTIPPRGPNCV